MFWRKPCEISYLPVNSQEVVQVFCEHQSKVWGPGQYALCLEQRLLQLISQLNIRGKRSLDLIPKDRQVRILVVEDNEPFRTVVSSMLRQQPNLQIVGEEQDGIQAVRQAEALQPDLILLDMGLPGLNGIEAARKIRVVAPRSKIVFLTQESAADIVEEAFALGAQGYVLKAQAGSELLAALEAVSQGLRFASHGLNGHRPPQLDAPTPSRKSGED